MRAAAKISDCGRYRYSLEREWSKAPPMVFCMLNPSTADASVDDPTIRRCIGFAKREGCGGIYVVNLFAYRATNPADLRSAGDPFGPENAEEIGAAMTWAAVGGPFVAAWGANPAARHGRAYITERARAFGIKVYCLGKTKAGAPMHPLYLPGNADLQVYP